MAVEFQLATGNGSISDRGASTCTGGRSSSTHVTDPSAGFLLAFVDSDNSMRSLVDHLQYIPLFAVHHGAHPPATAAAMARRPQHHRAGPGQEHHRPCRPPGLFRSSSRLQQGQQEGRLRAKGTYDGRDGQPEVSRLPIPLVICFQSGYR